MRNAVCLLVLLAPVPAACRSSAYDDVDRASAEEQLDLAEQDIQEGLLQRALARLIAVREVRGLDPDVRVREEELLEEVARRRMAELEDSGSGEMEDLYREDLPERLKARAGILTAEQLLNEGRRVAAYKMIKKVDQALPSHPERVLAGDVLARAGLALIDDDDRYYLFFRYRTRGIQALEYLVLHYPLDPHCPQAYQELSRTYEESGDLDLALERCEDLLLYHPRSAEAVVAGVRIAYLRLKRLPRDDLDRGELLLAHQELLLWLERHPEHELAGWARELVLLAQSRLVRSDLVLARYYERTHEPEGTRIHAERALRAARDAGLEAEESEAQAFLERVGAAVPEPAGGAGA